MFALTIGTLGSHFAVGKTIATVAIGLLGEFDTVPLMRWSAPSSLLQKGAGNGGCGDSKICNPKSVLWSFWTVPSAIKNSNQQGALKNLLFLSKSLLMAFLLESMMLADVPNEIVQNDHKDDFTATFHSNS